MIGLGKIKLLLLLALAVSQVFSSYWFIPGGEGLGASVFRVLLLVSAGFMFLRSGLQRVGPHQSRAMIMMFILALWMTASLFWSEDQSAGFRHILYVLTTIALIYVLSNLLETRSEYLYFTAIIAIVGVLITAFAFYEIETGFHFRSTTFDDVLYDPTKVYMRQGLAWFTFGNPNDLAVHLTICSAFLFLVLNRVGLAAFFAVFMVAVDIYLFQLLDARLALVAIVVFVLAYAFLLGRRNVQKFAFPIALVPLATMAILGTAVSLSEAYEMVDTSTFVRLRLIGAGIEMATRTFLIGVGAGGFPAYIVDYGLTGETYGIVDPHNAFTRQLGENGIIGLLLFLFAAFGPVFVVARTRQFTKFAAFLLAIIAVSPLLFMISSDPMALSSLHLYLAMIWVGCRFLEDRPAQPQPQRS